MSGIHDVIDDELAAFLRRQPVFFVATAPLAADGHVNLSPKGLDSFAILGPREVAYLDLTGSGAETIAHVRENGRITIMACAFEGPPRIVRLHGRADVVLPADPAWPALRANFGDLPGVRSIVRVRVDRIATTCGYAVPRMRLEGPRDQLQRWVAHQGEDGLRAYRAEHNQRSLDGLPALDRGFDPARTANGGSGEDA